MENRAFITTDAAQAKAKGLLTNIKASVSRLLMMIPVSGIPNVSAMTMDKILVRRISRTRYPITCEL